MAESRQALTLRLFTAMRLQRANWGGLLLLGTQLDERGMAAALAATGVGAASLFVESDVARVRLTVREGVCSFAVTTLDEALRILKNDIRVQRPVCVVLRADVDSTMRELAERGVRADATVEAIGDAPAGWTMTDAVETDADVSEINRAWLGVAGSLFPREKTRLRWQ